jgi:hypothetical protein
MRMTSVPPRRAAKRCGSVISEDAARQQLTSNLLATAEQ